ncbi:hypothetical protein CBF23_011175 [Marinomonas agarivorans]|nr:hypothetical protein CBF23_011175 [Marinomonas agarivorans]
MDKEQITKEQMELEKLHLEIKALKSPWYLKPANLLSFFSLAFAIYQYGAAEIKTLHAESKAYEATEKLKTLDQRADFLGEKASRIKTIEQKLIQRPESTTQSESTTQPESTTRPESSANIQSQDNLTKQGNVLYSNKIMDVWGYGVSNNVVEQVRQHLIQQGSQVGFGGLLTYKPSWLAKTATVFYYQKQNQKTAKDIAADLTNLTGITFIAAWGSNGLGVDQDEKNSTFFVHIVEQ